MWALDAHVESDRFEMNFSSSLPLAESCSVKADGFWCRLVAHFPAHLSPIWLEKNGAVVFSL